MTRKEQLKRMVETIESIEAVNQELNEVINEALTSGITASMHVGKSQEWFDEDRDTRVPEWLMGQFVEGHLKENYIAYNTGINLAKSFLDGSY